MTFKQKYTPEMVALIESLYKTTSSTDIAKAINERFPEYGGVTPRAISIYRSKHGMKVDKKIISKDAKLKRRYPIEMKAFLEEHAEGRTSKELADLVREHFKIEVTARDIRSFKRNNGICSHIHVAPPAFYANSYKKGRDPDNCCDVGEIRSHGGMLYKKVAMPNKWVALHRLVWEEHHGPMPSGSRIVFLDGNPMNCNIENLGTVSASEHVYLNCKRLRFKEPELTKTGVAIAKLASQISKRDKEN